MSQSRPRAEIATKPVLYRLSGMDQVPVRRDVVYNAPNPHALSLDIYYPPAAEGAARIPAVVFVCGYSDLGSEPIFGCKFKEMESFVGWARLAAASGVAAITYTNRQPEEDIIQLLGYVRENAAALRIDENRIGLWAASGNAPVALSVLMEPAFREHLRCAALCYPFTLDLEGSTAVAEASRQWRFANPASGKTIDALPKNLPLFVARAGKDQIPRLNETLDRFLTQALASNLPLTLMNHPAGPHAFDLFDDSAVTREIIRQILTFLQIHLCE